MTGIIMRETRTVGDPDASSGAPDVFGNFGDTVLTAAVRILNQDGDELEVFNRFFDLSPDVSEINKTNKYGCTPLFVAVHLGKFDLARSLLARRADINATNDKDNTIFDSLQWKLKHLRSHVSPARGESEKRDIHRFIEDIFLKYNYPLDRWLYDRYKGIITEDVFRKCEISRLRAEIEMRMAQLERLVNN